MIRRCAPFVAFSVLLAPALAGADTVGNIGAVNQTAFGTPPGAKSRKMTLGLGVQNRESLETSSDGSTQVVFLDTSTMTIGHNSRVTVDKFVYSGSAGVGQQSFNLTKGALRFIGGTISHSTGAEIKTPAATTSVRGGMVTVDTEAVVEGVAGTMVYLEYGIADVVGAHNRETLSRPGSYVLVTPDGMVSEPRLSQAETVKELTQNFVSATGQSGGASETALPNDSQVSVALSGLPAPNMTPWDGLNSIGAQWAGSNMAQSRAQSANQAVATHTLQTIQQAMLAARTAPTSTRGSMPSAPPSTPGSTPSAPPSTPGNPTSTFGLFSNGFCVWSCTQLNVQLPNSNNPTPGITATATFSYGTFTITFLPGAGFTSQNSPNLFTFQGPINLTIVFTPTHGQSITGNYTMHLNDTLSVTGGTLSNLTSFVFSGTNILNYTTNINPATLPNPGGIMQSSFFYIPNNYTQKFSYSYP